MITYKSKEIKDFDCDRFQSLQCEASLLRIPNRCTCAVSDPFGE